jgi:hypothetical protein
MDEAGNQYIISLVLMMRMIATFDVLPPAERSALFKPMAFAMVSGLAALHGVGVSHGDLNVSVLTAHKPWLVMASPLMAF